jgi:hypothetical protein
MATAFWYDTAGEVADVDGFLPPRRSSTTATGIAPHATKTQRPFDVPIPNPTFRLYRG